MVTANLDNEITVLYDRLHKLYVDYVKLQDICPTSSGDKDVEKLYSAMSSVNKCILEIVFGGMGTFSFLDNVNLTELYSTVFLIAMNVNEIDFSELGDAYLLELRHDINTVYAAIKDVLQIFVAISNS